MEYLEDGLKATIFIQNYLGGIYHLTADEVLLKDGRWIIQESKNSQKSALPDLSDIQDGLFKLIIYSNLSTLKLGENPVIFLSQLKLTGRGIKGFLQMPCSEDEFRSFLRGNLALFSEKQKQILVKLRSEVAHNQKLRIEIRGNA